MGKEDSHGRTKDTENDAAGFRRGRGRLVIAASAISKRTTEFLYSLPERVIQQGARDVFPPSPSRTSS